MYLPDTARLLSRARGIRNLYRKLTQPSSVKYFALLGKTLPTGELPHQYRSQVNLIDSFAENIMKNKIASRVRSVISTYISESVLY